MNEIIKMYKNQKKELNLLIKEKGKIKAVSLKDAIALKLIEKQEFLRKAYQIKNPKEKRIWLNAGKKLKIYNSEDIKKGKKAAKLYAEMVVWEKTENQKKLKIKDLALINPEFYKKAENSELKLLALKKGIKLSKAKLREKRIKLLKAMGIKLTKVPIKQAIPNIEVRLKNIKKRLKRKKRI